MRIAEAAAELEASSPRIRHRFQIDDEGKVD